MKKWFHPALSFLALLLALTLTSGFAQVRSKRLILKDGSYQSATKWELKSDRVRYFSAERYTWEELPLSMVDWPATEKYSKDIAGGKSPDDSRAAEAADVSEPEPPTVAPGLQLPDAGGIFLLDKYKNQPRLVEIVQNGSEINQQRAKNILRAVINPIPSGPTQSVELKGTKAAVQSHTFKPELFINVNFDPDDSADQAKESPLPAGLNRFQILKVTKKKDVRVLGSLRISLLGKVKERRSLVPTKSEQLTGGWIKVTSLEPLPAGEYAVVEMLNEKQMNMYVWDFGVDPNAPVNRAGWAPKSAPTSEMGTNETPVLEKRRN
ncbi:MAG TPA: hypothetical protein VM056_05655 [Terriglobales bacterium]|nr:hypothetical protein [Terriglobales bacterium]